MSSRRETEPNTSTGPDWRTLHLWQIQPLRDALVLLAVFGLFWLGYRLSVVTAPILLALTLAYLFEPLLARLCRVQWINRPVAAMIIIFVSAVAIVVPLTIAVSFGLVQAVQATEQLTGHIVTLRQAVDEPDNKELYEALPPGAWRQTCDYLVSIDAASKAAAGQQPEASQEPPPAKISLEPDPQLAFDRLRRMAATWAITWLREHSEGISKEVGRRVLGAGAGAVKGVISAVTSVGYLIFAAFLTSFFFFFFSSSFGSVSRFWKKLIPDRHRDQVVYLVGRMDRVIAAFVRGRVTIALILGAFYSIGYWLIGVPAPLIFGPLVGLVSLAPYMSGVLGMPGAMLLMLLSPSSVEWQTNWWWILFAPVGVSMIGQAMDDYLLTPVIQGKGTDMDMPTILFASIAGGVLGGFYGVLLAIPVAACLKILLAEVVWPKFKDWSEGRARDPLPISSGDETGARA
jgi:predicted PurR-regulated permease PerM